MIGKNDVPLEEFFVRLNINRFLGSVYNSYLSGVRSFFKSQLVKDSIINTLSSKAFSLVSVFLPDLVFHISIYAVLVGIILYRNRTSKPIHGLP